MDHKALLRAIETSDCKQFVDWYENAQQEVSNYAVTIKLNAYLRLRFWQFSVRQR